MHPLYQTLFCSMTCVQLNLTRAPFQRTHKRTDEKTMASTSGRSRVIHVAQSEQLERLLSSGGSAVIKFSAEWCGPCKNIDPLYNALSTNSDYQSIKFLYVDVDKNDGPEIQDIYRIKSLPTFVFVKGPRVINVVLGADQNGLVNGLQALSQQRPA